eukprot:6187779-Pleurochrysis_carterae.AAC.3
MRLSRESSRPGGAAPWLLLRFALLLDGAKVWPRVSEPRNVRVGDEHVVAAPQQRRHLRPPAGCGDALADTRGRKRRRPAPRDGAHKQAANSTLRTCRRNAPLTPQRSHAASEVADESARAPTPNAASLQLRGHNGRDFAAATCLCSV